VIRAVQSEWFDSHPTDRRGSFATRSRRSLEDREMDAFLDEEHKKRISEEIRQRKREKKLREGDSREKNLDSEPLIADISGIDSQDSVIPLNEKNGQDVYLASPSSESYIASPGFEYSKEIGRAHV